MKEDLFFILFLIFLTSVCDTLNQLFLKSSINRLDASFSGSIINVLKFIFKLILIPWVWFSGLFSLLSLCIWLLVLGMADLNFAFSVDSMHYILIAVASRFILKEKVGLKRWLGTVFIVLGIVLVSLS